MESRPVDLSEFTSEIKKYYPYLETDDIKLFIPRVAYEFAKCINSDNQIEIPEAYFDESSHAEISGKHLIIVYNGLYGKRNFNQLVYLFNQFDPDFEAYFTDTATDVFTYKRFYALCLNAKCFLKHIYLRENISNNIIQVNKTLDCYKKSSWRENNNPYDICVNAPVNHYPVHPRQIKMMNRKNRYYKFINLKVEKAILEWIDNRKINKLAECNLLLTHDINCMFDSFPKELFSIILFLMINKFEVERENKLRQMNVSNNPNRLFSGTIKWVKNDETRMAELCCLIFENMGYRDCAILDNEVVIKFEAIDDLVYSMMVNRLDDIVTENEEDDFYFEEFKNEKFTNTRCQYLDIFLVFPKEKLNLFMQRLKNEVEKIRQNEIAMYQRNRINR